MAAIAKPIVICKAPQGCKKGRLTIRHPDPAEANGFCSGTVHARGISATRGTRTSFLEARIRSCVRAEKPGRGWLPKLVSIAATAAIFAGPAITYQLGHLRSTVRSQESYIGSVSTHIATLMRVGLGDFIHCSVFRKYPKNPP
ncbi:MAG: hypothetical protein ABI995_15575, partial [Acidobacteriota bacterium]